MFIKQILVGALLLAGLTVSAQSPNQLPEDFQTGMLYGPKHAYSLTAPKGWVLDNQAWASAGIHAVFFPRGSSVDGSKVAYTRFFGPHPTGASGRAEADLAEFKSNNPGAKVTAYPNMVTTSGMKAVIRSTVGDSLGNSEWLAYIEAPTGTIFIAMVTKVPKDHEALRLPFDELVQSCLWLTDKVKSQATN